MKRMIASASVVALGAAGVHAATSLPGFASPDAARPWSISATLRGFYDDNPSTQPSGRNKNDSFGYQVNPSVRVSVPLEQTTLSFAYNYSFKYYDTKPVDNSTKYDQTHVFNAALNHAFSERYQLNVTDSFAIGQEPDTLRAGNTYTTFERIPNDNIVNYGTITLNGQFTKLFGLELGYANGYYNYADEFGVKNVSPPLGLPSRVGASLSGLLDRIGQVVHLDGRWQALPETVGVLGYAYAQESYTGDEVIAGSFYPFVSGPPFARTMSNARNSRSHYGYVGADHNFSSDMSGSLRAGVRYIDFYNDATSSSEITPYVELSFKYAYLEGSFLGAGFKYDRAPTSRFSTDYSVGGTSITTDAQATHVFATLRHQFIPNFFGNLTAEFQNSTFNGGYYNDMKEQYYLAGLNLEYHFPHERLPSVLSDLIFEVGYNYDQVDSHADSSFDYTRNRVYLGVTASY